MEKKEIATSEPLTHFSFKTELCKRVLDTVQPEKKPIDTNKKSSNCKTFDLLDDEKELDFDEMSKQMTVQSVLSNKQTLSQRKRTLRSNNKATGKKKPLSINFSPKTEFCNAVSDADEADNKNMANNKKSLNCKAFDLPNDEKEFDFDEMLKQATVQSVLSSKQSVSQKKRTLRSHNKATGKKKPVSVNFSLKTEFCNRVLDSAQPEKKNINTNEKSSNCKTLDLLDDEKELDFDEMSKQATVQSVLSRKQTASQKKRTLRSNSKAAGKKKPATLVNFPPKTELCNAVLDADEAEIKTIAYNKKSSNCKTFDLLDDEKELDFEEIPKQTVSQKKRTLRSNSEATGKKKTNTLVNFSPKTEFCNAISDAAEAENKTIIYTKNSKVTRKIKADSADSLADFSSKIELSNAVELENKIKDNNKTSNYESFDLLKNLTENFDKKSDEIIGKSLSSNKLTDQLSESSSSLDLISNLGSIIDKVKSLQIDRPIHIYSITPEGKGLSAVDACQNHLAYSIAHSHEIRLCSRNSLSDDIASNDLRETWLNFASAKDKLTTVEESENDEISSPRQYIFSHNDDVSGLCFFPNDNYLLSCSSDKSVKIISTTTYRVLKQYNGHGPFTDISVNARTTQFATTTCDPFHAVCLYDFGRKWPVKCFSGNENSLKCVRFHPNGLYVATSAADNCIKLWSVLQSKQVRNFKDEGTDHAEKIAFSPDGKYIASTHSGCVKIWDIASGRKIKHLETSVSEPSNLNLCYNYTGDMLAAGGSDKKIHIWNITSDESSEMTPDYHLLKSEYVGKRIYSIKFVSNFFSCVTD